MLFDPANIGNVPAEMQAKKRWVNWKAVKRKNKITKVPVNPLTRGAASSTDAATWADFARVVHNARNATLGIGFVFEPPDVGIDLDHCYVDGQLTSKAQVILAQYRHTWAELSPSGEGVHIYTTGSLPSLKGVKCALGEMYTTGRFFTVTGHPLPAYAHPSVLQATDDIVLATTYALFGAATPAVDVTTDDAGEPDPVLFEALDAEEPLFSSTWAMTRVLDGPKKDNTPSAYLLSLARMAVFALWPDQEIVRLLQSFLRKHGLPEGHRRKIEATIEKARTPNTDTAKKSGDFSADTPQTADQTVIHDKLTDLLKLNIVKIVQMGRDEAVYRLYLSTGYVLDLGTFRLAWGFPTWQRICFEHTGVAPIFSPAKWGKVVRLLHTKVLYEDSPETSVTAETQHWLRDYTAEVERYADDYETLRRSAPFRSNGSLYVNLDALLRHVHIQFGLRLTRLALANKLRVLGWEEATLVRTDHITNAKVERHYWKKDAPVV